MALNQLRKSVMMPNDEKLSFSNLSVMVVNNLQSEMLFGMNALTRDRFKSFKVDINNNHIVFEDQYDNKSCVKYNSVTVEEWERTPIPVFLSMNTRIPAHSSVI